MFLIVAGSGALAGGMEPDANIVIAFPGAEKELRMSTRRVPVKAGERVTVLTAGGGGHGAPQERDPALITEGLRDGFVSPEAARCDYGRT